jgi:hypothetical protein
MDQYTINRYQPGGDLYAAEQAKYGTSVAGQIANAALANDELTITSIAEGLKYGANKDTSALDALGSQLYNNPLGAPLEQAGKVAGNTFTSLGDAAKNAASSIVGNWGMWLVVGVIALAGFLYLGGAAVARRRISNL